MSENPFDLFGEVPVTADDVNRWLLSVPHLDPGSPRAAWYVKGWNVVDKIRQAKISGRWHQMAEPKPVVDVTRWALP